MKSQRKKLEPNEVVKENIKKLYIILMGLQAVKLILWFINTFYEKTHFTENKYSMQALWAEDLPSLTVFAVVVSAISLVMCILPIVKHDYEKRIFAIVEKIITIVSFIGFVVVYIGLISSEAEYREYGDVYSNGLTFFGYVQLISLIASIVIAFMLAAKTKAISRWKKELSSEQKQN